MITLSGLILIIIIWNNRVNIHEYFFSKHVIYWSENIEFSFNDFKDDPDYYLEYGLWHYTGFYLNVQNDKRKYVYTYFDKDKSWIKDTSSYNLKKELKLIKIRFNLLEAYARKANRRIDSLKSIKNANFNDINLITDNTYNEYLNYEKKIIYNNIDSLDAVISHWKPIVDSVLNSEPLDEN